MIAAVRSALRRWRRWRSIRRARLAYQERIRRARGARGPVTSWSTSPNGSGVYVRKLTASELEAPRSRPSAPRWIDRGGRG